MKQTPWDLIIIGAGPAGFMTAIICAEKPLRILILDSKKKIGAKLLISGGGRCNVTNLRVSESDYQSGDPRTVRNILRAFPPERVLHFFRELGVEMILEEGTKFFPKNQSAKTVLAALQEKARSLGVTIETEKKVTCISFARGLFHLETGGSGYISKAVVICAGGLSYPDTGSDGSGYGLAKTFGHTLVPTTPALTPLVTDDPEWKKISGITLPVRLAVRLNEKQIAASEGAMLFTHFGFSGPAILDISGSWLRCKDSSKKLMADFLSGTNEADLLREMTRTVAEHPKWLWKRFLSSYLPERLTEVLLKKCGADAGIPVSQFSKKDRETVLRSLRQFPLEVTGAVGYEKAEVTAGGIDLQEVDSKTLESKLQPGLFFAGEILDVDGRIGGFNFQWAWASGFVAGRSVGQKLSH